MMLDQLELKRKLAWSQPAQWKDSMIDFDERQLKEIAWAIFYTVNFGHGTVGHNQLLVISKLAQASGFRLGVDTEGKPSLLHNGQAVLNLEIGNAQ